MYELVNKLHVEWQGGDVLCRLCQYMQTVVTCSSTYLLVSLSIDRYDAVARPMNFSRSGRLICLRVDLCKTLPPPSFLVSHSSEPKFIGPSRKKTLKIALKLTKNENKYNVEVRDPRSF